MSSTDRHYQEGPYENEYQSEEPEQPLLAGYGSIADTTVNAHDCPQPIPSLFPTDYQQDQFNDNYYQQYYYQQQQHQEEHAFNPQPHQPTNSLPLMVSESSHLGHSRFESENGYHQEFLPFDEHTQQPVWHRQFDGSHHIDSVNIDLEPPPNQSVANVSSNVATATASPVTQDVVARFLAAQRSAEDKSNGAVVSDSVVVPKFLKIIFISFMVGAIAVGIFIAARTQSSEVVVVTATDDRDSETATNKISKPNIFFFLADDLGWNSMGYQDFDLSFATPFLTSLASTGIIMDSYYAQEVCTPSRAALLTGRHPLTTGMQYSIIMPTTSWGLSLEETTLAEVLNADGYKTHMLGKWHLGHYSPRYLPTARGFDSFIGFMSGEGYYWSKRNPDHPSFIDFMTSNTTCYVPYEGDDVHTYSTFFYRDKAVQIIEEHNMSQPMFMYLAFQAVHDPFTDINHHSKGVPKEYLSDGIYDKIHSEVAGHKRRQYAMALSLIDDSVKLIHEALDLKGMLNNTYTIFASDNGGCYLAGGKNGPLRGTKGSLFEGGVKVDSFIYSSLIPNKFQGKRHSPIMHVSDWFPTILNLTDTSFSPKSGMELDGVSHVEAWYDVTNSLAPRDYVLYNYFYDIKDMNYDKWTNGSFALRNSKYKLMHTYDSSIYGNWFNYEDTLGNDDSLAEGTCNQALAMTGDFTYFLFDIVNDPYESNNIYESTDSDVKSAKEALYAQLEVYEGNAVAMTADVEARNLITLPTWKNHADHIVPWTDPADLVKAKGTFPADCYGNYGNAETPTSFATSNPSLSPSSDPTPSPTSTSQPTIATQPTFVIPTIPTFSVPTIAIPTVPTMPTFQPPSISSPTTVITFPTMPTFSPPSSFLSPSYAPTPGPTTMSPSFEPTFEPTWEPTFDPTDSPSCDPTVEPTRSPTFTPTPLPTDASDDWDDDWDDDNEIVPQSTDDDWDDDDREDDNGINSENVDDDWDY